MICYTALILSMILFAVSQEPVASVEGTIVEAASGRPMAKVEVELRSVSMPAVVIAVTRTAPEGKFHFRNVAPGSYRLVATRPGQITAESARLTLTPGQRLTEVQIAMSPGAVISGRITDRGQPVAWADAVVIRAISTEGRLSFTPVLSTRTNDLGEYSLFWLPPGRYYIMGIVWDIPGSVGYTINPDGTDRGSFAAQRYFGRTVFMRATSSGVGENEAHLPMYYPGTPDPQLARVIKVASGGDVRGIDVDVSPLPLARVRGRVTGMPNAGRLSVDMRPLAWTLYTTPAQRPNAVTDPAGNFEMKVVPGRYTLTAFGGGMETFTIVDARGGDVTNAVVSLSRGRTLEGRIVIERETAVSPDPALSSLRVTLRPDPEPPGVSSFDSSSVLPDGSFTIPGGNDQGPPEGDFRVLVAPILLPPTQPGATPRTIPAVLQNLYVKSIKMGDVEVLDDRLHLTSQTQGPMTIVIGSNPGALEGRVLDDRQQLVPGTTVVLVHDNGLRYRVDEKTTSSDIAGRFEFRNVPPGEYKLFAWENIEHGSWQDPTFMRELVSRGTAVRIEEGRKTSLDVKVIPK
jgi:hypothetical protein